MATPLRKRVDDVFEAARKDSAEMEWLKVYVQQLHENHLNAEKMMSRSMARLIFVWFVCFAVGSGIVSEGDLGVIKLSKLQDLLVLGPVLIGFASYSLGGATFHALILRDVVGACYANGLPKLFEHNLESLMSTSTLVGVEQSLEVGAFTLETTFRLGVLVIIMFIVFLGGAAAIAHITWLMIQTTQSSLWAVTASATIGTLFWLRGATLAAYGITV